MLYIVPTPIGNPLDITLRGMKVLSNVDFVICEHRKEYNRLCVQLDLPIKQSIECQRKNEKDAIPEIDDLLSQGKTAALVSDCGTPLFEDPGQWLIPYLIDKKIEIISLPGANSLIASLPLSHFPIRNFYFAGFITQKKELRVVELKRLLQRKETVCLLETPYRFLNMLELLATYASSRELMVPFNLTMNDEKIFRGKAKDIIMQLNQLAIKKGEFLVFIAPNSQ